VVELEDTYFGIVHGCEDARLQSWVFWDLCFYQKMPNLESTQLHNHEAISFLEILELYLLVTKPQSAIFAVGRLKNTVSHTTTGIRNHLAINTILTTVISREIHYLRICTW
jgi:hypothetical protein